MEKIKRILKNKSGSGFPLIIAVTLSLVIVFWALLGAVALITAPRAARAAAADVATGAAPG